MSNLKKISEVLVIWEKKNSNCAQATGKGLLDHFNYKDAGNVLFSSFFPFGGGFMSGNICGAVSGTLAAMSFILGKKNKSMEEIMHLSDQMKEKFVNEFGSINCAEIMAPFFDMKNPLKMQKSIMENPEKFFKSEPYKLCTNCVNKATIIAKELIEKSA